MKKNNNKTTTGRMLNRWLSELQIKSSIGKVSHVISLHNKKKNSLRLYVLSEHFSGLLPEKTDFLPKNLPFFNRSFDKKKLKNLFSWYYANRGEASTFSLVETLQKLGFSYAMKAGISLGVDDLKVPPRKSESLTEAVELLANTKASVNSGNVTALEEFQQFVDTWHRTSENLKTSVVQNFSRSSLGFFKKQNMGFYSKSIQDKNLKPWPSSAKISSFLENEKSYKKEPIVSSKALHTLSLFTSTNTNFDVSSKKSLKELRQPLLRVLRKGVQYSKEHYNKKHQFFERSYSNILNPVYMMAFSGARGNLSQVRQLVGMRGLMADPQGQLVEFPIQSNFREGLTVTEYMISCYGARKGLVDTALRTAAAGYLTRRLVDVSHHQIVRFVTCGTKSGILLFAGHNKKEQIKDNLLPSAWKVSPRSKSQNYLWANALQLQLKEKNFKKLSLTKRGGRESVYGNQTKEEKKDPLVFCVGRVLARDIPGVAFRNQEIDISLAASPLLKKTYDTSGIYIRSPLTCISETGICQLCYGWSVSANRLVGLGEAVGIIAAQSIGEPGTQLTMRTFHTGGVFSGDIMEECRSKHAGIVEFQNVYLGLLVRTAGGAIAFCLKTPAIFQIKGGGEITTYNVSSNTLLFVRQGENVIVDSLLAQIPNLPTIEESTGESTKTILSELAGEVRQKATVNPQLASLRILAGQEYKQFYFFNFGSQGFLKDQRSSTNNQSETRFRSLQKNFTENSNPFSKTSVQEQGSRLFFNEYKNENKKLEQKTNQKLANFVSWPSNIKSKSQLLEVKNPTSFCPVPRKQAQKQNKKKEGLVHMFWGAHRLGNNKTFSININGSKSQVIIPNFNSLLEQLVQTQEKTNNKHKKFLDYHPNLNIVAVQSPWRANHCELVKTHLLVDLRVFVACKIHENPVLITSSLNKRSNNKVSNKVLTLLSSLASYKSNQTPTGKPKSSKDLGLLHIVFDKKNTFPNVKNGCTIEGNPYFPKKNLSYLKAKKLKDFFVYCTLTKQLQWLSKLNKINSSKKTSLSFASHRKNSLFWLFINKGSLYRKQFSINCLKLMNKQSINSAIQEIATLSSWPKAYRPNMLYYGFLFWTFKDLIFFRFFAKQKKICDKRISINKKWWGHEKQFTSQILKNISLTKKSKGHELINFLHKPKKTKLFFEEAFPNLLPRKKLFFNFNIEEPVNQFDKFQLVTQKQFSSKNFLRSFNSFFNKNLKPKMRLQDAGEICPLKGNTDLQEFKKTYRSLEKVSNLNSGLLMHYNRVSYKVPLCFLSSNNSNPSYQETNPVLNKERLVLIRSLLALLSIKKKHNNQPSQYHQNVLKTVKSFGPQIGDFINTGDEIIKECASAYCGQIIEKSPLGLTLRLTQNILYSNLRNRPAKINRNVQNGFWISKGAPLVTLPYISNVTGDIVAGIPKIEQLFEARGETLDETVDKIWATYKVAIVPRSKAVRECFKEIGLFVVAAIQKVYSSQGVHIADKHLEVIIRQMTRRALIVDPGDTEFLPEEFVDLNTIECVNWATYGDNATYRPRLIGITKASLTSNSFLSSASFQQTARVLERETVLEKTDRLLGLKERVMMGALINAGTGELKTTVQLADRSRAKFLSTKLVKRLSFFSRRKVTGTIKKS